MPRDGTPSLVDAVVVDRSVRAPLVNAAIEARPPDHFVIETVGVECPVYTDPALDLRGRLAAAYDGHRAIFLREWDETVLLHEVLHRIFELQNEMPMSQEQEEVLVGRIEKTLYAMGWRWTENHPWASVRGPLD